MKVLVRGNPVTEGNPVKYEDPFTSLFKVLTQQTFAYLKSAVEALGQREICSESTIIWPGDNNLFGINNNLFRVN